ncbi:MAG: exosortase-associated EpsI family protein [Verrucomicrobia bacterium]|jgi:hypothetical protein|nr:exosortase-associated EpsI family protein [Verrucomicrobiota bacterium]MBT7699130.1 exosortase-associated EpsI family protein [Verrucomicrobiota bacterium]
METKLYTRHLMVAGVLVTGMLLAAMTTRGRLDPAMPVRHRLPTTVGPYTSTEILYCQSESCAHSFMRDPTTDVAACPECMAPLDTASLAEKQLLPADTEIDRRVYMVTPHQRITVSVVRGGYERRSIHKPQVCLVGQGHTITRQYRVPLALTASPDFELMAMEMDGSDQIFAYWFTDGHRVTASHLSRLLWIAWDGVIHNKRRRWAYISLTSTSTHTDATLSHMKRFIQDLHPLLISPARPASPPAKDNR